MRQTRTEQFVLPEQKRSVLQALLGPMNGDIVEK